MAKYTLSLLDIDYTIEENKPVIRIFGRTAKGKSIVAFDRSFEPYFYILAKNPKETAKKLKETEFPDFSVEKAVVLKRVLNGEETEIIRVFVRSPSEVPSAREKVRSVKGVMDVFEADILFNRRYVFDKGLDPMTMIEIEGEEIEDPSYKEKYKADLLVEISGKPKNSDQPLPDFKIMSFDIEVYNPKGLPNAEKDPITMLSFDDGHKSEIIATKASKKFENQVEKVESEAQIIERFQEIVDEKDADILVGYNSDNFDMAYIRDRMKKFGKEINFGRTDEKMRFKTKGRFAAAQSVGRVHMDLFHYVSYILRGALGSTESRSLKTVAHKFLKEGDEKKDLDWKQIWQYWDAGGEKLETLFDYSLTDADITRKLADNFLPKVYEISKLVRVPAFDAIRTSYGQLVENYLIWNAYEKGEVVPNRPGDEEKEARYESGQIEGAYVKDPEVGMHENVALLDFRSLYPTIIISHNIDPSTIDCKCCKGKAEKVPELGHWFCQKRKGLIPKVLENILDTRINIKKKMKGLEKESDEYQKLDNQQYALKILANSAYGYLAYRNARWYSREGASSTTAFGRMYIKKIIDIAEKRGLNVIYGDTDSLFAITKEGKIEDKIKDFLKEVNDELPGVMELEFEGIYKRGIFVSKKRYALMDEKGKTVIKGLEFVRKDWTNLAKNTQKEVLESLLKEGSPEKAFEIIKKVIKRLKEGDVKKEELAVYTELTRPIERYKVTAPHVEVAKRLQKKGEEIRTGSSIGYIIIKGSEKNISDRARSVDEVDFSKYDKEYYIQHQIIPAVSRVMEALGYEEGDLLGKKQGKLGDYFK